VRTLADGLEPLEHLDRVGPVLLATVRTGGCLLGGFQWSFLALLEGFRYSAGLGVLAGAHVRFNARVRG
jgi:hypothetical protein